MGAALAGAGPWAAFLLLCSAIVVAYYRGKIISPAEHKRAIELEQRIGGFQEERAKLAEERADKATAALQKLVEQLPPSLEALRRSTTGAP